MITQARDVLWEHIFTMITSGIRSSVTTLDMAGPAELISISSKLLEQSRKITKDVIFDNRPSLHDPDPETTRWLEKEHRNYDVKQMGSNDYNYDIGLVLTHSPRVMGEYSYQVGRRVEDDYSPWSDRNQNSLGS